MAQKASLTWYLDPNSSIIIFSLSPPFSALVGFHAWNWKIICPSGRMRDSIARIRAKSHRHMGREMARRVPVGSERNPY